MKKAVYFLLATLLLLVVLISCKNDKTVIKPKGTSFYVGTYTNTNSEGIYAYSLVDNGNIIPMGLAAKSDNPSFLTKSIDKRYLITVNENEDGSVTSFRVEEDSLIFINRSESGGAHPCFVTANNDGYVLTANYSSGIIGLLQINEQGKLSPLLDIQQHVGKGSHERQEAPHAHSTWFHPDGNTVISVDLGSNELLFSSIDHQSQKIIPSSPKQLKMDPGAGPRHLSFHPEKPWIYVVNELNSTVSLVKKDGNTYNLKSSYSTLPEDYTEESWCADIHISDDGKFLYVSNRGHNSIAIFSIGPDGDLEPLGHETTRGKWPRNFALSPDNDFLLVANQNSNNIVSFKRDSVTGTLEFISEVEAPTPVCILF